MFPDLKGLTQTQAKAKLAEFGPNELPERPLPSDFSIFVSQLKNPLVYILVLASLITFFIGHISDTAIIFLAVLVNTVLGFIQERRAEKSLHELKKLIHPRAKVIRGGQEMEIEVSQVVPEDIVVLNQGDKVPADGELVEANRAFFSEAILTGESLPVAKKEGDEVFMGTALTAGRAFMRVKLTGEETQMGKIALKIQEPQEDTPLKQQVKRLSKQLSFLVLALTLFVFLIGLLRGNDILEMFTTSVALAVSAIPEGLLVGLTVVLAIGMQRILKRKGLVRRLVSAETLGGVTIICADKTGTLTSGKMQVVEAVGEAEKLALQAVVANDLDDPLAIAAYDWGREEIKEPPKTLIAKHARRDSIPFSSKNRFFASLNEWEEEGMLFVNGAPEFLLAWSTLSAKESREIKKKIEQLTQEGKRLVGMARKKMSGSQKSLSESMVRKDLEWVGLLVFTDPTRPGVKNALRSTQKAGVKTLVITGDYANTAMAVMDQLSMPVSPEEVVLGQDLEKMSASDLQEKLPNIKLFARTTPEQKLKIVESLKRNKEVVAMMGDGVNDAPALKKADIGIVVGEATDVARETADLVLLDSRFETIVAAIEEGRGIFENIRKILLYLMSDAFEEIIIVVGTIIFALPLPITAGQILWINLISDGFPDLALTVDPKTKGIMDRPPRSSQEGLVAAWMRNLIFIVSLAGGIMALILFYLVWRSTQDAVLARSVAFATLGVNSLLYVFSIRTLTEPFWQENPLANNWLNLAVVAGFALQVGPFFFSVSRNFLRIVPLPAFYWLGVFTASLIMFIIIEVAKDVFRHRLRSNHS